jgi:plasmid rolling circle replication initiator protein Rep
LTTNQLKSKHSTSAVGNSFPSYGFNSAVSSTLISSHHTYLDNRTTTKQKPSKRQSLSASERLAKKQKTKDALIVLLKKVGESELVDRLKLCGSKFSTITCGSHIVGRSPKESCNFRLCPHCAAKRSNRINRKYAPMAAAFLKTGRFAPVHLVLTQTHKIGETLADGRKRLNAAFKKLQKRRFWLNHFGGGLSVFEFTITEDGSYHCHLHILAFRRRFFDIALLRSEWLKLTGDSFVLRLDKIDDLSRGLREVVKYISKPLDIERFKPKTIRDFLALKGARLFSAFGQFAAFCRKFDATDNETDADGVKGGFCEGDCCPVCEMPLFEMVLTVKDLIGFMRKIESVPKRAP